MNKPGSTSRRFDLVRQTLSREIIDLIKTLRAIDEFQQKCNRQKLQKLGHLWTVRLFRHYDSQCGHLFDANVADDFISYSSRVSRVNGQISEVAKLRHLQRAMDDGGADFMRIH